MATAPRTSSVADVRSAPGRLWDRALAAGPWAAAVVLLCVATYLFTGYRYQAWPQPGFLQFVLRYSGELQNDWFTSLPPGHWAAAHAFGVLPPSWLEPAIGVAWVLTLVVFWTGFLSIAGSLGMPVWVGGLAGLVTLHTWLGGFGVSEMLAGYFYPSNCAFALSVAGLALALRRHWASSGALIGLSTLVHIGLGPLAVLLVLPILWVLADDRRRALVRFALSLAIVGGASVIQLLSDQTSGAQLSPRESYEFLTVVRQPHHMLYSAFSALEYWRTAVWTAGLMLSLWVLWQLRVARALALLTGVIAVVCTAGAVASVIGWPLVLVQIQTARLSSYVVMLAVLTLAAALYRLQPVVATAVLAVAFVAADRVVREIGLRLPELSNVVGASLVCAITLVASLVALLVARRWRAPKVLRRFAAPVAVAAIGVCAVSLIALRDDRFPVESQTERDWADIAAAANRLTAPGTIVVTPPDQDGFRSRAARPNIVEMGSIRMGQGDDEWRRRVLDLTQEPAILDPDTFGTDHVRRFQAVGPAYERTIASSRVPPCRYGAAMVVARTDTPVPPWLERVYANGTWQLLKVRPDACDGFDGSASGT